MKPDVVERKLEILQNVGIILLIGGMCTHTLLHRPMTANVILAIAGSIILVTGITIQWRRAEREEEDAEKTQDR